MANYKLTYQDYIRKFKKQNKNDDEKKRDISVITEFSSYMFDISSNEFNPIDSLYWYKKSFISRHRYSLITHYSHQPQDQHQKFIPKVNNQIDYYSELVGENGWLSSYYNKIINTADFLTGYYFAKILIRIRKGELNSFHYGCADNQLIKGIAFQLKSYMGKWNWYGADKVMKPKINKKYMDNRKITNHSNIINGITQTGDICDINVIKSLRIQIEDAVEKKLSFYIADIYPKTLKMLYNSIILAFTNVDDNGFSVIRMPDPHEWNSSNSLNAVINFIILLITQFHVVKLFKTPWFTRAKYYIILYKPKQNFPMSRYTSLIKYISSLDNDNDDNDEILPLFNEAYFNKEEGIRQYATDLITTMNLLIDHFHTISYEEANEIWMERIMEIKEHDTPNIITYDKDIDNKQINPIKIIKKDNC
jgi:hypothetical protein